MEIARRWNEALHSVPERLLLQRGVPELIPDLLSICAEYIGTPDIHSVPEHVYMSHQIQIGTEVLTPDIALLIVEYAFELHESHMYGSKCRRVNKTSMSHPRLNISVLDGWHVDSVIGWSNNYPLLSNGIALVYRTLKGHRIRLLDRHEPPYAKHHQMQEQKVSLSPNEYIVSIRLIKGSLLHNCFCCAKVKTNTGTVITIGSDFGIGEFDVVPFSLGDDGAVRIIALDNRIDDQRQHYLGCIYERMYPRTKQEIDTDIFETLKNSTN